MCYRDEQEEFKRRYKAFLDRLNPWTGDLFSVIRWRNITHER